MDVETITVTIASRLDGVPCTQELRGAASVGFSRGLTVHLNVDLAEPADPRPVERPQARSG